MRNRTRFGLVTLSATALAAVIGCGGGNNDSTPTGGGSDSTPDGGSNSATDGGSTPDGGSDSTPTSSVYSIGGTISGLTAAGLVLQDNGGDDLTVAANATSFVFATQISSGSPYSVTVLTQPAGETCAVFGGSGTADANVQSVSILCKTLQPGDWTWVGGSSTAPKYGRPGVYGTLGAADAANIPGGRQQSVSWRDRSGNLWLFGGYGVDSAGASGQLNDLWKFDPTQGPSGEWTWMSGTKVSPPSTHGGAAGSPGVYGTLGVAAATNIPGAREQAVTWIDASGAAWIFGGEGIDTYGVTGELNDLWKFDPKLGSNGQWTWMADSMDTPGGPLAAPFGGHSGVYGTLGTPSATNAPGGRYGAVSWMDAQGNLWLFGGCGMDSVVYPGSDKASLDYLNDLWKFTPGANGTAGQWTWMGGASAVPSGYAFAGSDGHGASGVYGSQGTAASTNSPGGRDAAMSWLDASGNVWIFGGIGIDSGGTFGYLNDLWKYTPSTTGAGRWTWVSGSNTVPPAPGPGLTMGASGVYGSQGTPASANTPGGRFSAATWVDASGNLWLLGGQGFDSAKNQGALNDLWKFDTSTGQWTWVSGSTTVGTGGQPGLYGTLGTPAATNVPGGRFGIPTWTDGFGSLWLFGGLGYDSTGAQGYLNDLWTYQP